MPDALRDPRAYPDEPRHLRLVETHISWVFLTGRYAYKVKKPVRLDFLDFSTPASRRHYCREELRLNRHFAPDLYMGGVDIVDTGERLAICPPATGAVVDCAVQMREFAASEELDSLLSRGLAGTGLLAEFGGRVAALHESAPRPGPREGWATPAATVAACLDNLDALRRLAPVGLQTRVEALAAWTLLFDVRFLPNPHFVAGLREATGLDEPVLDFLERQPDFENLVARLADLLGFLLPRYAQENRSYLTVGVGCTGGRRRSVAVVERLADRLAGSGWTARRNHRELARERG